MKIIDNTTKREKEILEIRKSLIFDAENLSEASDITGYAIVVWSDKYRGDCSWYSEYSTMPGLVVPEYVKQVLIRQMRNNDTAQMIKLNEEDG